MKVPFQKVAFIGAGNMATSLIGGLVEKGYPAQKIWVSDRHHDKCEALASRYGLQIANSNAEAIAAVNVVVLAVKPQSITSFFEDCKTPLPNRLWISLMAGVTTAQLAHFIQTKSAIIRVMPNTPALLGAGASGLFANAAAQDLDKAFAEQFLAAVGTVVWVDDEIKMNAVTALSGSGPAYFFQFIQHMISAGISLGLSEDTAKQLTLQTAWGAIQMARESTDIEALLKQVKSPGGTTEAALDSFEKHHFQDIVLQAMQSAFNRGQALSEGE